MMKQVMTLMAALCGVLPAQGPQQGPVVVSPEVHADRRVTFRILAPKAGEAALFGDWMKVGTTVPMAKGAGGVWSVTVGPLEPSIYIYHLVVDGVTMADPVNPRVKLRARTSASLLELKGEPPTIWDARDVPHGSVEINWAKSKVLGGETRSFWVYTPPGYEKSGGQRYPVLYLFHGSNDTAGGWVLAGQANYILDNLLAEKKAVPMIVVMPFGHAVPFGSPREVQAKNTALYEEYVLGEVLPFVEAKYRVKKDRASRAIAGLSMGGGQTMAIAFRHPEMFSDVGAFSAAIGPDAMERVPAVAKNPFRTLWFACGKDDGLIKRSEELDALLKKAGVAHTYKATEGAHTYTVWRKYLAEFAPLLFRN
ncbi:MAG: esterase [Bryobacterales bacterium]|nr:esterase [Bryobacterales bacterium]